MGRDEEVRDGKGGKDRRTVLPHALARTTPRAPAGSRRLCVVLCLRRGFQNPATPHSFRHSFAPHLLKRGQNIRTLQELLGYPDVNTTMFYAHVLNRGPSEVSSPRDLM